MDKVDARLPAQAIAAWGRVEDPGLAPVPF
jgi:hypothetical protein